MKKSLLDKFFIWADGDTKVLFALAMVPLCIFNSVYIANSEIGNVIYVLGGLVLDDYLKIYTLASASWAAATFFLCEVFRIKSNWLELLACAATFLAAMAFYLFF